MLIDDLKHLTAVRFVQHSKFAEENAMASFLMSAKSGDQVRQAFLKIVATLAGVPYVSLLCYMIVVIGWLVSLSALKTWRAESRFIPYYTCRFSSSISALKMSTTYYGIYDLVLVSTLL